MIFDTHAHYDDRQFEEDRGKEERKQDRFSPFSVYPRKEVKCR